MNTKTKLWSVYIEGPDEYQACESEEAAVKKCEEIQETIAQSSGGDISKAWIELWPFGPESHAEELERAKP